MRPREDLRQVSPLNVATRTHSNPPGVKLPHKQVKSFVTLQVNWFDQDEVCLINDTLAFNTGRAIIP